ncbi:glutaredoxin family protein [Photobacterium piscicola]|uniref:glutaredoxin family protein n=1 Tax=Photobacterium piscicola TaxID=1378299 RepID=UPI002E187A4B|nr:glutaredoxin family protein [Photobacterium piscicola]
MLITLYSTQGCHLCEQAYGLLVEMGVQHQVSIVDIAFDDALFSRYGVTIPVLAISNHGDLTISKPELHWPFDRNRLATWLTTNELG